MKRINNNSGFTLIEIIVVLIIVGVLAAIALPNLFSNIAKSKGAEAIASMGPMKATLEACGQKNGGTWAACNVGASILAGQGNFYYEQGLHDGTGLGTAAGTFGDASGWSIHASSPNTGDNTVNYITLIRPSVGGAITCTGYGSFAGIC